MEILLISIASALLVAVVIGLLLAPNEGGRMVYLSGNSEVDGSLKKLVNMFGNDFLALLPNNAISSGVKNSAVEKVFKDSGNPWNLSIEEFFALRVTLTAFAIILDLIIFAIMAALDMTHFAMIVVIVLPVLGYIYPMTYYEGVAKNRSYRFKVELPEAIDYLIMALSGGGYSLQSGFEETYKYLSDGIIKTEFEHIINDLNSGMSMESALRGFSDRAPTDGIKAFSNALINANKLSVSMNDILRARANASRRDLEMEIERKVVALPTKVTMALSPTAAIAIIVVAIAPSINTLMEIL